MVTREPTPGGDDPNTTMKTGGSGTSGSAYDRTGSNVTGTTGTSGTSAPGMAGTTGGSSTTYSPHGEGSGSLSETQVSGGTMSGMSGSGSSSTDSSSGSGSAKEKATEMAGTAKDKATEVAGTAKDKATELTSTAKEKLSGLSGGTESIDAQRDTVAGGLDTVATQLRDKAETIPGGEKTTQIAQNAAEKIETASSYLRENEVSDMMTDVERLVRSHPTESLVVALAAGFLVGRAFKS